MTEREILRPADRLNRKNIVVSDAANCSSAIQTTVIRSGSPVEVSSGHTVLVCPILGSMRVVAGTTSVRLVRNDLYVSDPYFDLRCEVAPQGLGLLFVGETEAWHRSALENAPLGSLARPFPAVHRQGCWSGKLLRLARVWRGSHFQVAEFHAVVALIQSSFLSSVQRCPGYNLVTKQSAFARLQRARHFIELCAPSDLAVSDLAFLANYTVSHFITLFQRVFGETPYSMVGRHRILIAGQLLKTTTLPIADIRQVTGYPSRYAFTRAIRQHFHCSPDDMRAGVAGAPIF